MPIYYDENYPMFFMEEFVLSGFIQQPDGVLTLGKLAEIDKILVESNSSYTMFMKEDKRTCIVDTGI